MNANFIFLFLFVFLVILVTMYQLKLNSLMTCLLTIIIILLINKLIVQKDYFTDNKNNVMRQILSSFITNLEVKTKPATNINSDTDLQTQTTISQNELIQFSTKKQSFLDILKEILSNLNN
tara:strand:- start:1 stop:363 length:363 start_codon:yes stop_codon:yes gene_type:complete